MNLDSHPGIDIWPHNVLMKTMSSMNYVFMLLQSCYLMFHIRKHFVLTWKINKEHFVTFCDSLLLTLLKTVSLYRDIRHHLIMLNQNMVVCKGHNTYKKKNKS